MWYAAARGRAAFVWERCAWCGCVEECGQAVGEGEVETVAVQEVLVRVHEWGGDAGLGI
jgi:hypothetical protein